MFFFFRKVCHIRLFQQRAADLAEMITRVIREGLEGLVLKDVKVLQTVYTVHCILFIY